MATDGESTVVLESIVLVAPMIIYFIFPFKWSQYRHF